MTTIMKQEKPSVEDFGLAPDPDAETAIHGRKMQGMTGIFEPGKPPHGAVQVREYAPDTSRTTAPEQMHGRKINIFGD